LNSVTKERTWIEGGLEQFAERKEAKGGWRKLHNDEFHYFTSPNIIEMISQRLCV
jgi:hypothetical protein